MTENDPPTLDDVARSAGVSTATVSRCLNNPAKVTDTTRAKVLGAVERLGYTPNFSARALAAKRTFTIGAIIPTMENDIFARGIQAFQETLNAKGYMLLVSSTAYHPDREAEQIKTLVARGADGLLLIGYERDDSIYEYLAARKIPYLLSWAHREDSPHPAIGFDNRAAMEELARAVLDHGHRNIAVISGIRRGNDRATDRVEGIFAALRSSGIDPEHTQLIESPYSLEAGAAAFDRLIAEPVRPTAVLCINDVLAVGAMQRAIERGLRIPADISITGFDDIDLARLVTPQLTTVHLPHRHMGSLAAQELIKQVETRAPGRSHRLSSSLRLRQSLGAPPLG